MENDMMQKLRMRVMPPSSQSFHDSWKEIVGHLWSLEGKCDAQMRMLEDLTKKVDAIYTQACANDAHSMLRWQELYRKSGESAEEVKRRFFAAIPPASGVIRQFQLANARLLHELDSVCREHGLTYWMCFGSLVATVSRAGSIPWDDDVDICMMREDIDKLQELLKDDERLQITVAYDNYVLCKQVRFSLRDENIPCFVDVCAWDWAREASREYDDKMRELRLSLMREAEERSDDFACWSQYPILYAPGSGQVVQGGGLDLPQPSAEKALAQIEEIESLFEKYEAAAYEAGILCEEPEANGLAYSVRNIYDAPWRRTIFPKDMILPTSELVYEGYSVLVPRDYEAVCDECYPGWPYLPQDIIGHDHMPKEILRNDAIRSALTAYAQGE